MHKLRANVNLCLRINCKEPFVGITSAMRLPPLPWRRLLHTDISQQFPLFRSRFSQNLIRKQGSGMGRLDWLNMLRVLHTGDVSSFNANSLEPHLLTTWISRATFYSQNILCFICQEPRLRLDHWHKWCRSLPLTPLHDMDWSRCQVPNGQPPWV